MSDVVRHPAPPRPTLAVGAVVCLSGALGVVHATVVEVQGDTRLVVDVAGVRRVLTTTRTYAVGGRVCVEVAEAAPVATATAPRARRRRQARTSLRVVAVGDGPGEPHPAPSTEGGGEPG